MCRTQRQKDDTARTRRGHRGRPGKARDNELRTAYFVELHTIGQLLDVGAVSHAQYEDMKDRLRPLKRCKNGDLQMIRARTAELQAEAGVLVEKAKQAEEARLEVCVCVCVRVCACMPTQGRAGRTMMCVVDTRNPCTAVHAPASLLADVIMTKADDHPHACCCGSGGQRPLHPLGHSTASHGRGRHGGRIDCCAHKDAGCVVARNPALSPNLGHFCTGGAVWRVRVRRRPVRQRYRRLADAICKAHARQRRLGDPDQTRQTDAVCHGVVLSRAFREMQEQNIGGIALCAML